MSPRSLLNSGLSSLTALATQSMALLAHSAAVALPSCFRLRDCRKAGRSVHFRSSLDPSQCRHHSLSATTCSQSRSIGTFRTLSFSAAAIELLLLVKHWVLFGSAARTPSDLKRRVNNLLLEISCPSWRLADFRQPFWTMFRIFCWRASSPSSVPPPPNIADRSPAGSRRRRIKFLGRSAQS